MASSGIGRWSTAAAVATFLALASAAPARAVELACPSTFHVLHDDRIGALRLSEGHYTVTIRDSARLSCAHASDLLGQFLEDWDGRLPRPWVLDVAGATFTRGAGSAVGFGIGATDAPAGGGTGGRHPAHGVSCPAFFNVLHNDHIGFLNLRRGPYRITLLAVGRLTCASAALKFAGFLQDFDGVLPRPWTLDRATGTFFGGSINRGFRVKSAVGDPVDDTDAGRHPSDGTRCRATFRVQHRDVIGKLRLPAGPYILTALRGGDVSCSEAADEFREFLRHPEGDLPRPWVLDTREATFTRGRRSPNGFRVKPARRLRH